MSTPSGFRDWCTTHGLNPFHPEDWATKDHEAFIAWKRERVWAKWIAYAADGTLKLLPRARRWELMREDLVAAREPLARNPYKTCPCHPTITKAGGSSEPRVTRAEVEDWRHTDIFERAGTTRRRAKVAILSEHERFAAREWRGEDPERTHTGERVARALAYLDTFRLKETAK